MFSIILSNGESIPILGLGTWELKEQRCTNIAQRALQIGCRHIDTAYLYGNHTEIGIAIQGFPREQFFLTSKLSNDELKEGVDAATVERACDQTLKDLGVEYLDLYLYHNPDRTKDIETIMRSMIKLIEKGKVKSIGVCNFTIGHLEDLPKDVREKIVVNQVEFHPHLYQRELWAYCKRQKIQIVAYRSLGKGKMLSDPLFTQIGKKYGKSPVQVLLRWAVQKGIAVIPKPDNENQLQENLAIFDFALSREDMKTLDHLEDNVRYNDKEWGDFNYRGKSYSHS